MSFYGSLASKIVFGTSVNVNGRTRDNLTHQNDVDVTGRATDFIVCKQGNVLIFLVFFSP